MNATARSAAMLAVMLLGAGTASAETPTGAAADRVRAAVTAATPATWRCSAKERRALRHKDARTLSDADAQREWTGDPRLRELVQILPEADLAYWREMRWLHMNKGICRPAAFLRTGMVTVRVFGHDVRARGGVASRLLRADRALRDQGESVSFGWIGGFSPRTVRGTNRLSRHAMGEAIDFDPGLNPYLSRAELRLLHKLTRVRVRRNLGRAPGERWDDFRRTHVLWMERAGPWFEEARARRKKLRAAAARRLDAELDLLTTGKNARILETGILSLPRPFVIEMERAGLRWRTDFGAGPDLMHFSP